MMLSLFEMTIHGAPNLKRAATGSLGCHGAHGCVCQSRLTSHGCCVWLPTSRQRVSPFTNQLARIGFDTLGLQTYLTAGPKETRAWTIHKGWKAPQAAGVIHTDFEKGFIKAEVISFDHLVAAGSVHEARAKGKARMEGKDYVMQDGDVVEFRFAL